MVVKKEILQAIGKFAGDNVHVVMEWDLEGSRADRGKEKKS
jgi:hypothetical protein